MRQITLNVKEMLEKVVPENGRISGLSSWAGKRILLILEEESPQESTPKKKGG